MVRHITPDQLRQRCLDVTRAPAWVVEHGGSPADQPRRAAKVEAWLRQRRVPHFRMDPAFVAQTDLPRYTVYTHGGAAQTPVPLSTQTLVDVVRALKNEIGCL